MSITSYCRRASSLTLVLVAIGCGPGEGADTGSGGNGGNVGNGGNGGNGAAPGSGGDDGDLFASGGGPMVGNGNGGSGQGGNCDATFAGVVRDFRAYGGGQGHPDFETFNGAGMKGIVQPQLGPDHKPVYALPGPSQMTAGKEAFDQWYRDVPGVNMTIPVTLTPTIDGTGLATYDDPDFFPIDGKGFGSESWDHNYHFTFELHMTFVYQGGEVFSFLGDDDLWVFVNGRLAIDLGGLHEAQSDTLDLDARAADLGIEKGKEYTLDFFQAERHTTGSKFKIQSTLAFTNCDPIIY